jgi:hypothetical protein
MRQESGTAMYGGAIRQIAPEIDGKARSHTER